MTLPLILTFGALSATIRKTAFSPGSKTGRDSPAYGQNIKLSSEGTPLAGCVPDGGATPGNRANYGPVEGGASGAKPLFPVDGCARGSDQIYWRFLPGYAVRLHQDQNGDAKYGSAEG